MNSDKRPSEPEGRPEGLPKDYSFSDFQKDNRATRDEGVSRPPQRNNSEPEAGPRTTGETSPYSKIPISHGRDVERTTTQELRGDVGEGVPNGGSPVKKFFRKNRNRILVSSIIVLFLLALCVPAVLVIALQYKERAEKYDLDTVGLVEGGSIAVDVTGKEIGQVTLRDRRKISLDGVPQHLIDALVATEDSRFFEHDGVDFKGIARAALANLKAGGISQGGSTITQQLARHSFDIGGRTFDRKFLEIFIAKRIEERFTKEEILTHYLNRIYLGSGYWGVEAAANGYFGKDAKDLTLPEAATLCAIIKSPTRFSPFRNPDKAEAARNRTLERMQVLGMISEKEYDEFASTDLEASKERAKEERPNYLLAAIRREALDVLGQYTDLEGLTIHTSVNLEQQRAVKDLLDRNLRRIESINGFAHASRQSMVAKGSDSSDYLQGACLVFDRITGDVEVAVGGRDFADSQFDRVWQAKRKPGTAITPLLYASLLDAGQLRLSTKLLDAPMDNRKVMIGGKEGMLGEWGAERGENDFEGEITALYAMVANKNGATVRAAQPFGVESFSEKLADFGITSETTGYPNTFLGESAVRFHEFVRAYSVFPNGGSLSPELRLVAKIEDKEGNIIYTASGTELSPQVVSAETAEKMNRVLTRVPEVLPVRAGVGNLAGKVAGRNGMSHGQEDAWFVGYNDQYVWGVWIGFDKPKPIAESVFSVDTALPLWSAVGSVIGAGQSTLQYVTSSGPSSEEPNQAGDIGNRWVCMVSGAPAGPHCAHTKLGDLTWKGLEVDQKKICGVHEKTQTINLTKAEVEPNLFERSQPVLPNVDIVIGGNPWAAREDVKATGGAAE